MALRPSDMIAVQEAKAEMFPRILELLQQFNVNNPTITREDWQGIFSYSWKFPDDPLGFVLIDGEKIVGFLGTICSRRMINGREEKFCNLTSWVAAKSHRQHSMMLLSPVLKLADYTVTNQTPARHIHPLFVKLGFQELERKRVVLYPFPELGGPAKASRFRATTDTKVIRQRLNEPEATIFKDHLPFQCGHLLIYNDETYSYAVFTKTKGRRFYFSHIHYISNKPMFFANLNKVRFHLLKANRTLFTMIDSRFAEGAKISNSRIAEWAKPTLYKSTRFRPEQIDNLYSELILLHL
jgi:hypothetical protein